MNLNNFLDCRSLDFGRVEVKLYVVKLKGVERFNDFLGNIKTYSKALKYVLIYLFVVFRKFLHNYVSNSTEEQLITKMSHRLA